MESDNSCPSGVPDVPALGKFFGPYRYGQEATISIPAGPGRRFDLLGFINPYASDPYCSKSFEVKTIPDGSHTRVVLRYGDYEIDPEGTPYPGLLQPASPFGRLGFFFHSDVTTLAPGRQTVNMNPVAWNSDPAPQSYGCHDGDDEGSSPYVRINAPFTEIYRPESAEADSCSSPVSGLDAPYQCIHTGVRAGPIRIECPSGASTVKVFEGSSASSVNEKTAADTPTSTVSCAAADPKFNLTTSQTIDGLTNSLPDHFVKMIPLSSSGTALATGSWTAVFRYSSRYQLVQYLSNGTLSNFVSPDNIVKFFGYRKTGDVRELFYETDRSTDQLVSHKFVTSPADFRNPALSESAASTDVGPAGAHPSFITQAPTDLGSLLTMGGFALTRLVSGGPGYLQFFNTSSADFTYGAGVTNCIASSWCTFDGGSISAFNPKIASDSGKISVAESVYSVSPTTLALNSRVFTMQSTPRGSVTETSLGLGSYVFAANETLSPKATVIDASASNAVIATLYASDVLTPTTTLRVRECPTGLSSCTGATPVTLSESSYVDMDLLVTPLGAKYVVGVHSVGTNTFTFKKTGLFGATSSSAVATDSTQFHPAINQLGISFGVTTSFFSVKDVKVRALRNKDQGISENDLMIKVELETYNLSSSYTLLYRSQDLGENWYLVRAENGRSIVDMAPFHFYRKDSSGYEPPSYDAGFMILRKTNLLEQDWAGF